MAFEKDNEWRKLELLSQSKINIMPVLKFDYFTRQKNENAFISW